MTSHEQIKVTHNLTPVDYPELCASVRSTIDSQLAVLRARLEEAGPELLGLEDSGWDVDLSGETGGSIGTPPQDGTWTRYIWTEHSVTVHTYEGGKLVAEMIVAGDQSAHEALLGFQAAIFDFDDFVYRGSQPE